MDQSKSNSGQAGSATIQAPHIPIPKRGLSLEFWVGLFCLGGLLSAGWLAVGLGEVNLFGNSRYQIFAEFDNISGLKNGASVEIGGVPIGLVTGITLKDPMAVITLEIDQTVRIKDDDIASIRTKGIIGDRYVKLSRGASDQYIPEGGKITETESVVDIEDIIGKVVHSLGGDKEEDEK